MSHRIPDLPLVASMRDSIMLTRERMDIRGCEGLIRLARGRPCRELGVPKQKHSGEHPGVLWHGYFLFTCLCEVFLDSAFMIFNYSHFN